MALKKDARRNQEDQDPKASVADNRLSPPTLQPCPHTGRGHCGREGGGGNRSRTACKIQSATMCVAFKLHCFSSLSLSLSLSPGSKQE